MKSIGRRVLELDNHKDTYNRIMPSTHRINKKKSSFIFDEQNLFHVLIKLYIEINQILKSLSKFSLSITCSYRSLEYSEALLSSDFTSVEIC